MNFFGWKHKRKQPERSRDNGPAKEKADEVWILLGCLALLTPAAAAAEVLMPSGSSFPDKLMYMVDLLVKALIFALLWRSAH